MTREEVYRAILESPLADMAGQLEELIYPYVRITPSRLELEQLSLGASRLGGVPDLPIGTPWPHHKGQPLAFLAQIRLADFLRFPEAEDLKPRGWLCFFYEVQEQVWGYDPAHRGNWQVLHFDVPLDDIERADASFLPSEACFPSCALRFSIEHCLPPSEIVASVLDVEFDEQDEDALDALLERLCDPQVPRHRLFGFPDTIQGDMRLQCQLVSHGLYCGDPSGWDDPRAAELEPGLVDWLLLLQLDTDEENLDWMWGDCGRLYFMIREQDLEACAFDQVWMVLQCY